MWQNKTFLPDENTLLQMGDVGYTTDCRVPDHLPLQEYAFLLHPFTKDFEHAGYPNKQSCQKYPDPVIKDTKCIGTGNLPS